MCTYNGFFLKILQLWYLNEYIQILRRVSFFTAYSVDVGDFFTAYSVAVGDFLPHTQYTWHNFCRSLSRRGIFFSAHSVSGKKPKWRITA